MSSIQAKREAAKITQDQLAKQMGVTQSAVAKWETGGSMPRASKLPELAKVLGCSIDKLYENIELKDGRRRKETFEE